MGEVVTIPASVKEIDSFTMLYGQTICTTSGTYAEAYAKKEKLRLIVDGVLQESKEELYFF